MKIVADNKIPFLKGALEPFVEVSYVQGNLITKEIIADADALLIRTRTKCDEALLKGSSVKFIGTATIGFDHIDTGYCDRNNIVWTNAPGCNSSSVCQYVVSALLKLSLDNDFGLKGKTLGIIGVGNVGSKIEKAANALGMTVILNDPPRAKHEPNKRFETLDTVLENSDIITVHVPLTLSGEEKTFHLFDDNIFKKIKKKAWFVNTSRGEVVSGEALKRAINVGTVAGAILDVWENEPDIDKNLMNSVFIATPHIAGYSTDGKANGTAMIVDSLCKFFNIGITNWKPQNIHSPENPIITIETNGKSHEQIIGEAVFNSYDIAIDDCCLKSSPTSFEKQRDNYMTRREFSSFTVVLQGENAAAEKTLKELGFNVTKTFQPSQRIGGG
jgi:erythronate-4-phosphate dehydrogenase